jgi:hypothetical protein
MKWLTYKTKEQCTLFCEPGTSVSIVSEYELDDRATEVRFPAEAKDFSSNFSVQNGSGAQPPVQWVLGVLSPG